MPYAAPEKITQRDTLDPKEFYRYSTVQGDVNARPIDPFVTPAQPESPLKGILDAIASSGKLVEAYGQYKGVQNKEDQEQAVADQLKGEQDPNGSRAYIRKYEELQGHAQVTKFHAAALEYTEANKNLPPDEFDKGFASLRDQYILGPSDNHLRGFAPGAMEVENQVRAGYIKHQVKLRDAEVQANVYTLANGVVAQRSTLAKAEAEASLPPPVIDARPIQAGTASRKNNLGNIRSGPNSFRSYSTPEEGAADAVGLLRRAYRGLTLTQIGNKWAPPSDNNDTPQWIRTVSQTSGLDPNAVPDLGNPEVLSKLLTGIARAEKSKADLALFTPEVIQAGVEAGLSGKPIVKLPAVPQINYTQREQQKREDLTRLQEQLKGVTDKNTVTKQFVQAAFDHGRANHDPHALDFLFIPDKDGFTILKNTTPELAASITSMRHTLQEDSERYQRRAEHDLDRARGETTRAMYTKIAELELNKDIPQDQKGSMKLDILRQGLSAGADPGVVSSLQVLATKQAEASYAEFDVGEAKFDLQRHESLEDISPAEALKKVEYLAKNGFLTENTAMHFMNVFGNKLHTQKSFAEAMDHEEYQKKFQAAKYQMSRPEPDPDGLNSRLGIFDDTPILRTQKFEEVFFDTLREWRQEQLQKDPNAKVGKTPTGKALDSIFEYAKEQALKTHPPKNPAMAMGTPGKAPMAKPKVSRGEEVYKDVPEKVNGWNLVKEDTLTQGQNKPVKGPVMDRLNSVDQWLVQNVGIPTEKFTTDVKKRFMWWLSGGEGDPPANFMPTGLEESTATPANLTRVAPAEPVATPANLTRIVAKEDL